MRMTGRKPRMADEAPRVRRRLVEGIRVVALTEHLDTLTAGIELDELLRECVEADRHVVLDVSKVGFVDSSALALLNRTSNDLRDSGRTLVLLAPRPQVREVVQLSGLDDRLALAADWSQAKATLAACDPARADVESGG